jgi:signal transduction histidine kinase
LKKGPRSGDNGAVFTIGSYVLTEQEVAKRKAYLEISPDDELRLREAHSHLQQHTKAVIDRFYDYLLSHETTRSMLSAPGLVERLKGLQTRYFGELTSGVYDLAYFEQRLRVGLTHQRIGLSPEWYLGAYVKYLHIASDVLSESFGRDFERFYRTMVSLTKVIYLDMGLALDAYHFSAQAGLRKTNEELRQLQAAKKQLTDMIVHDLQNPLTGISSALQVLGGEGSRLTASEREALEEALRRCQDLSQMIMNVLQVSRAEAGALATYVENVDLVPIAREVAESFRRTAELGGRRIDLELPSGAPVRSDQTLLRRILQNLIRNALRHTPSGTRVLVRADGRRVSVEDDGPGIPPEVQTKLFEPFGAAALRDANIRVDTGLGLPSCRVMARAIGAELGVESDGRRGTRFTLTLPESPPET